MVWAFLFVGAYLIGAIPFGLLIGWYRGIDVRRHGSGNIGATNVRRVVGRRWGRSCLVLDVLKGLLPTLAGAWLLVSPQPNAVELFASISVGLAAVLGHVFPIYLRFRGGKGVATTIGVALGVYPYFTLPMLAALGAYAGARGLTGMVSVGSIALAVVFPVAVLGYALWNHLPLADAWPLVSVSALMGVLILVRHRGNIARLLRGEEPSASDESVKSEA